MRLVLDSWFGHTTEEIFSHWRRVMTQNKKQREMDEGEHTAQIKRVKQEEIEKLELAAKEVTAIVTQFFSIKNDLSTVLFKIPF